MSSSVGGIGNGNNGDDDELNFQGKLESLVGLVSNRCEGLTADDDEIEHAVSSLLSPHQRRQHQTTTSTEIKKARDNEIVEDEDDYDDNSDDDGDGDDDGGRVNVNVPPAKRRKKEPTTTSTSKRIEPTWTGEKATIESLEKQEKEIEIQKRQNNNSSSLLQFEISEAWKDLENIPLGTTGAKIMITFGDGPKPDPVACATALLATRQCIQNAVKDARALRRKMKIEYDKARVAVNLHRAKKKERAILGPDLEGATGVDLDLYFKAIKGNDKLSYENPCGFDTTQLEKLFPEEMYAYQRWNKMHQAYTASKNDRDDGRNKTASMEGKEDEKEEMTKAVTVMNDDVGGHLKERLAQFDIRTEKMKEKWYMAFSEVRKGSFLARGGLSAEDRAWEKERKKGNGRKKVSTWEALPSSHIKFLHWVGFDQRSALPPPDTSTTEALAFLGYDFMAKIIEKSIFLKCLEKRGDQRAKGARQSNSTGHGDKLVMEIGANDQLTKEDIEKALSDSTVVTKPLYNASESTLQASVAAQIYFGPGFEDRIEMEMEQITMGRNKDKHLTKEELEIRQTEDKLFDRLKAPPTILKGIMDVLGDENKSRAVARHRLDDERRRKERDAKKMNTLKNACEGKTEELPKRRTRSRSKK